MAICWASGNREETVFENPDRIDLGRSNLRNHLSFGGGIHLCMGAQLARLEARVALEELLSRTSRFEMGGPAQHLPSVFVRTPSELPIAIRA